MQVQGCKGTGASISPVGEACGRVGWGWRRLDKVGGRGRSSAGQTRSNAAKRGARLYSMISAMRSYAGTIMATPRNRAWGRGWGKAGERGWFGCGLAQRPAQGCKVPRIQGYGPAKP